MMVAVQQAKRSGAKWHVIIAYEVYVLRSVLLAMHTAGLYGEGRARARACVRARTCVFVFVWSRADWQATRWCLCRVYYRLT